ncbi:MAG: hypothetical protein Q8O67_31040 [Deltaproteobacteria bacterium]|nr:hypothetical protein [Deltaproteobacteria bacterium]
MPIELETRPGPAVMRDVFLASHPPFSVALDGYVFGEPFLEVNERGPWRNFNHHELVDRSCTSATCEQARRGVLLGLYDLFADSAGRRATLWVNDCDQDVCLSTWILMNPERAAEPLVRVLSQIVDLLDMSAGAFPMPHHRDLLGEVRWIFDPYVRVRPFLSTLDGPGMREVIRDVHHRIEQFVMGRAETLPLTGIYTQIGGGDGWVLVEITHQSARERMVAAGIRAAVELSARRDGRFFYSLWRRSEYVVTFPVPAILHALNVAEGCQPIDPTGWGGAGNVGGSPRQRGSKLTPQEVEDVVARAISR